SHPERRRVWHEEKCDAGNNRADEKVWAAATQAVPCPIAHRTDDRLNQQTCYRACQPQVGYLVGLRAQIRIDAAHVGELQTPAELYTQEPKAHVPYLPETQTRFAHYGSLLSR